MKIAKGIVDEIHPSPLFLSYSVNTNEFTVHSSYHCYGRFLELTEALYCFMNKVKKENINILWHSLV